MKKRLLAKPASMQTRCWRGFITHFHSLLIGLGWPLIWWPLHGNVPVEWEWVGRGLVWKRPYVSILCCKVFSHFQPIKLLLFIPIFILSILTPTLKCFITVQSYYLGDYTAQKTHVIYLHGYKANDLWSWIFMQNVIIYDLLFIIFIVPCSRNSFHWQYISICTVISTYMFLIQQETKWPKGWNVSVGNHSAMLKLCSHLVLIEPNITILLLFYYYLIWFCNTPLDVYSVCPLFSPPRLPFLPLPIGCVLLGLFVVVYIMLYRHIYNLHEWWLYGICL